MKILVFFLFFISTQLYAQSNWTYEPEELLIRSQKKGSNKIDDKIFSSKDFKIRYSKKSILKPIDYKQDLSKLSLIELRMKKYELYARLGYLFDDVVIRDYFNKLKWYQPIYWLQDIDFTLNQKDELYYQNIKKQEDILLKKLHSSNKFDTTSICNKYQFEFSNKDFNKKLIANGFVVVQSKNTEIYYTYENNKYAYFPNFVTTDFYLQLLHLYFENVLITLEEDNFIPLLKEISKSCYDKSQSDYFASKNSYLEAGFSQFYFSIAYELLTGLRLAIPESFEKDRIEILKNINDANGIINSKIFNSEIDFSHFTPRSHYLLSKDLTQYFKTMMWFGKIPFVLEDTLSAKRGQYISYLLECDQTLAEKYNYFVGTLSYLIGNPNNYSIIDFKRSMADMNSIGNTGSQNGLKISPQGINADGRVKVFFFSQLFTPDSYIMSKLINLTFDNSRRAFPKALDVFAVFGNKTAEGILLNYYNETKTWPGYLDSLNYLKGIFSKYNLNKNTYGNWLNSLNMLFTKNESYPLVMRNIAWDKKNLNSALASYTELKHDAILYTEQPSAAECDGDDELTYTMPPDPSCVGYVEPNLAFWESAKEIIVQLKYNLLKFNIINKDLMANAKTMLDLNEFFLDVSKKELKKETLTKKEYSRINFIGRIFEDLKSSLKKKVINPVINSEESYNEYEESENDMALVADVFTTNNTCLELGVGTADDIYVIVDIGGYNYLTRGSVFSFYEFKQPISDRLTDKAWRQMLEEDKAPKREGWYNDIMIVPFKENINILKYNPSSFK